MIELTEAQVDAVSQHLNSVRLSVDLRADLLDHLCCEIEDKMNKGDKFQTALQTTTANWEHKQLTSINRQIYFTNKVKPMILRISTTAAIAASIFLLFPFSVEKEFAEPAPNNVELFIETQEALQEGPPTASPLRGVKLSDAHAKFGPRIHPLYKNKQVHKGIDFKAKPGTPVLATADGEVTFAGTKGNYGILVTIQHADGYVTSYAHLQSHAVKVGQQVTLGEEIAAVGNTGMSTGPHLHYEVRKGDVPQNPIALLGVE